MNILPFDELTLAKIAFQSGYERVFHDEDKGNESIATPDNWLIDSCVVNDFANETGLIIQDTDEGTLYSFNSVEEKEDFYSLYAEEILKSSKSVNELLIEFQTKLHEL